MTRESWRQTAEDFVGRVRRKHKKNRRFSHSSLVSYIASKHPLLKSRGLKYCRDSTRSQLKNAGFGGVIGLSDLYSNWDRVKVGLKVYYQWTDGDSVGWDKDYSNPEKIKARRKILEHANPEKTTLVFAATKGYEVQELRARHPSCDIWNCEAFKPVLDKWVKFRKKSCKTADFHKTDKQLFESGSFRSHFFGLLNYDVMRSIGSHLDRTLSLLASADNADHIAITVCRSQHHCETPEEILAWTQKRLAPSYTCRLLVNNYKGESSTSPMTVLLATHR